jgi:hypothetical protein
MIERNRFRNEQVQRYSAVRTYEIRNFEGKLSAQEVVRVDYEAPDKKTFTKTSEQGSGMVRHLVFDRLIQSESEASSGQQHHDSAITSANYIFKLAGEEDFDSYHCFVLEAIPRRNDKYLFEGRVWIDMEDFAIVKIAGHPAKKPSFWINRAEFVREYRRIDGFWVPARDETTVEVKLHGRRRFTINHDQYVFDSVTPPFKAVSQPKSLTHELAATVPIGALTAWQGLFDRAKMQSVERVLIHGAAGAWQLCGACAATGIRAISDNSHEGVSLRTI